MYVNMLWKEHYILYNCKSAIIKVDKNNANASQI